MRRAALPLLLLRIFLATWLAPIRLASAWVSRNGRRSTSALRSSTPAAADDDAWLEAIVSARNSLERKAQSLQRESDKAQKAEELRQLADLWTSNLYLFQNGARSASAWDLEGQPVQLTLEEEYSSASDYVASLYEQARKRSRAVSITEERLEETQRALERLEELRGDWEAVVIDNPSACRIVQDQLLQSASLTGFQAPQETPEVSNKPKFQPQQPKVGSPASNVRKLTTPGGCVVLVGRNRRGNEYLTFQVARGNDVWMHSRGCPGAHVVLQQRRGSPPATEECIQFAANLAAFYSDARNEVKADITLASAKHLLKPPGAPLGAVQLRQEDRVMVGYAEEVPEELKLARAESGQSGEFRSADKAKRRKKTLERSQKKKRSSK